MVIHKKVFVFITAEKVYVPHNITLEEQAGTYHTSFEIKTP